MASKGKKEAVNVKEKKSPSPSNSTIQRRRSLGPTTIPIPIPSSPDRIHKQIQQSPKQQKAIKADQITPKGTPNGSPSRKFTPPSTPDKTRLERRRSLDKLPSHSQLPKPQTAQNPRERNVPSPSTSKGKTTTALQRPAMKEKSPRQTSALPKPGLSERPKTNLTSPRLGLERSSKQSKKDVEKPQSLKNVSKTVKKVVPTSHVKQKIKNPCISPIATAATSEDESLVVVDDSKIQDTCNVEFSKEMVNDELSVDLFTLEENGVSDLVLDEQYLNQEQDEQISETPIFEMEESQDLISEASSVTEGEFMHYQQETIPQEDEYQNEDQTVIEEPVKVDQTVIEEPVKVDQTVEESSIDDVEESKELAEAEPEENLIVVSTQPKKDSPAYNDVIEETASRLREQRKNKVRALVGAFETVISLEDPMADSHLPR